MNKASKLTEADLALCRSALYEALALGFRPPNQETVSRLLTQTHNQALTEIGSALHGKYNGSQSNGLTAGVKELMR